MPRDSIPDSGSDCNAAPKARAPAAGGLAWAGLLVVACAQPLAQLTSGYDWRADLASHFPEPALLFTLLLFAVALRRRRRVAVALAVLACWQAAAVFRYARPNPVAPEPGAPGRLKVLMANVLIDNDRYNDLMRLIRAERPDVVGLVEYTHAWQAALAPARGDFAIAAEFPAGASGLALWFRRPPIAVDPAAPLRRGDRPFLHAVLDFAGANRDLFLLHPRQPLSRHSRVGGNPELAALGRHIASADGSTIVTGDLNTSDGSANFRAFLDATGLRDSRYGFGRQGSFPALSPYRIAIDHALVSPDLAVVERRLGPWIGSDHYPLVFVLAPASARNRAANSATSSSGSSP